MKKLLLLALLVSLIILALPTSVIAADPPEPFDFSKLLTEEGDVLIGSSPAVFTLTGGFCFTADDLSSLDGILSTATLNGIPVFLLDSPTRPTTILPAAQTSEHNKTIYYIPSSTDHLVGYDSYSTFSFDICRTESSDTIGYAIYSGGTYKCNENYCDMYLYISSNNAVYPIIVAVSDADGAPEVAWSKHWPTNNEELTVFLQEKLDTNNNYTFYITPTFGKKSSSHKNLLYLPITANAGKGGSITEPGEKLFRPGDINQKYTITADEGYTIYYVQVDGKAVPNSINCGDTAAFTFDAIYGTRSINAVFKRK